MELISLAVTEAEVCAVCKDRTQWEHMVARHILSSDDALRRLIASQDTEYPLDRVTRYIGVGVKGGQKLIKRFCATLLSTEILKNINEFQNKADSGDSIRIRGTLPSPITGEGFFIDGNGMLHHQKNLKQFQIVVGKERGTDCLKIRTAYPIY